MMAANWKEPKPAKTIMDMNVEELKAERIRLAKLVQEPHANNHDATRYNMAARLHDSLYQAKHDAKGYLYRVRSLKQDIESAASQLSKP